jgi:hypothetical protein
MLLDTDNLAITIITIYVFMLPVISFDCIQCLFSLDSCTLYVEKAIYRQLSLDLSNRRSGSQMQQ